MLTLVHVWCLAIIKGTIKINCDQVTAILAEISKFYLPLVIFVYGFLAHFVIISGVRSHTVILASCILDILTNIAVLLKASCKTNLNYVFYLQEKFNINQTRVKIWKNIEFISCIWSLHDRCPDMVFSYGSIRKVPMVHEHHTPFGKTLPFRGDFRSKRSRQFAGNKFHN